MNYVANKLLHLIDQAKSYAPIRVAVVDALQTVVIETLREAHALGIIEPRLIGDAASITALCKAQNWVVQDDWIIQADTDSEAAEKAVELARTGQVDAVMKGNIHTDVLMHALLDKEHGLRVPGRRVSHVFIVEVSSYPKLIGITDAAINIAPDLNAKAQILQNTIELFHLLGIDRPKVAVLSAVETVNTEIASTLDAACLTLMSQRDQLIGATVDGPLAFDNAISRKAADEKGIVSPVAGDADILLVPDLISGNILAKNLEYLAKAVAAGVALGFSVPVVLTSRADPAPARLASLAIAVLMHHRTPKLKMRVKILESSLCCAPQPEHTCCPPKG
ncbi:MAG: bifunctional enoyl-CoA hydratase/phosphate acetyltransferase [Gammaproteobacteria bacterium]|nr:bifunctional enoyl-CoA hydratase/phosphate acetyltransferase [Gammaproteobacteria bacterium]MBU0786555.1 bifunctional enoyl-CoA hydratase/phosphate acetyltransferase [Gammaproteobacteria bacterium]MBU0817163.1 bifunctional enoyl-CoA hydratase/phosphate acetyltransferase [Gammaproteobacteria bacterium]MBU1787716.1 bifunctional enoyl-CoA hydratase/phosphate acetyltransferase [Gammaproteobacteria bacterium]